MKKFILDNRLYFIGTVFGAVAGYAYWHYVGCISGTCAITSKPLNSTLYFSIMGALLFGMFKQPEKANTQNKLKEDV